MSIESSLSTPLLTLPPEIYRLFASHIPLQSRPSALLALSLTGKQPYEHVHPLLYEKLILKSEEHARLALGRISTDDNLGTLVRELHILSDLSISTREDPDVPTIIDILHGVIKAGMLPNIVTLHIKLLSGWYRDPVTMDDIEGYDRLPLEFWKDVKSQCPRLRELFCYGIGDTENDPWIGASGLYNLTELPKLSALVLIFRTGSPLDLEQDTPKLLNSISSYSSSLHTLSVSIGLGRPLATPIMSLTFPHLKVLELSAFSFSETADAMDFWARHPGLEKLLIDRTISGWFSDDVPSGLLPNLTHFKAYYADVISMKSHLPQLHFLSINQSTNGQVPYLLRSVIPDGLPGLKSLEINQRPSSEREIREIEGAMWYETADGQFRQEKGIRKAYRTMMDNYMHSIVRGAPNLEELCLQGFPLASSELKTLASDLTHLPHLRRLYYRAYGNGQTEINQDDIEKFIAGCRPLAELCSSLTSVTNVSFSDFPYLKGNIVRDPQGALVNIIPGRGFGMELLGGDKDPFPENPLPYS